MSYFTICSFQFLGENEDVLWMNLAKSIKEMPKDTIIAVFNSDCAIINANKKTILKNQQGQGDYTDILANGNITKHGLNFITTAQILQDIKVLSKETILAQAKLDREKSTFAAIDEMDTEQIVFESRLEAGRTEHATATEKVFLLYENKVKDNDLMNYLLDYTYSGKSEELQNVNHMNLPNIHVCALIREFPFYLDQFMDGLIHQTYSKEKISLQFIVNNSSSSTMEMLTKVKNLNYR